MLTSGPADLQPLTEALLAPEPSAEELPPLPQRPAYRLLACEALQQPSERCVDPATLAAASRRLLVVNLLPLFGVLGGVVLLVQQLWRRWRGGGPAAPHAPHPMRAAELFGRNARALEVSAHCLHFVLEGMGALVSPRARPRIYPPGGRRDAAPLRVLSCRPLCQR